MKTLTRRLFESATRRRATGLAALVFAALLLFPSNSQGAGGGGITFTGSVTDQNGAPIVGATVRLIAAGIALTGIACDLEGVFTLTWKPENTGGEISLKYVALEFSSIGYRTRRITLGDQLPRNNSARNLSVILESQITEMDGVSVFAGRETGASESVSGEKLIALSRQSFAHSNPLEAVRGGAISRSGSAFGSQIRFSGSSPDYKINGASMGKDPAHYGMFSLLPTEALDRLTFSDHSVSARSVSPGNIEMDTDRRFGSQSRSTITISALETVGAFRGGNERYFVGVTARKSILDKLVEKFTDTTSPTRIPPTRFQDLFVNSGLRISPGVDLFFDQYHTRDFLELNSPPTSNNPAGVSALQQTRRDQFNLELRGVSRKLLWKITAQAEFSGSEYSAHSGDSDSPASLALDLVELGRRFNFKAEMTRAWNWSESSAMKLTVGAEDTYRDYSQAKLSQRNWNFLPPQAASDNPNLYQLGLNLLYPKIDAEVRGSEIALYAETERSFSDWTLRAGARVQQYDYLAHNYDLLGRLSLSHRPNKYAQVTLSYGSYAETPLGSLIEPYQILVRQRINQLNSVKSQVASLNYQRNYRDRTVFGAKLFAKRITDIPTLTPTFSDINAFGFNFSALTDLGMRSLRNREYIGASLSYRRNQALAGLFGDRLDFSASYGLTLAHEKTRGIQTLVGENAPHQAELSADYRASRTWTFGSRLSARSGYRYTAARDIDISAGGLFQTYTGALDRQTLANENRERFRAHIMLNVSARYESGVFAAFAAIGNLLNRKNPIISAHDGFVYDAGILPSIGFSWKF